MCYVAKQNFTYPAHQHMSHITLLSMGCPALTCYYTWSHKRHDIRRIFIEPTFFSPQSLFEIFLILRWIQPAIIKTFPRPPSKVTVTFFKLYRTLNCLNRFDRNSQISNLMSILLGVADVLHTDRYNEQNRRFPQFCRRT